MTPEAYLAFAVICLVATIVWGRMRHCVCVGLRNVGRAELEYKRVL